MRQIRYKKKQSLKNRRKMISMSERTEEKECITFVRKSFIYKVARVDRADENPNQPQIFIKKFFDTRIMQEKFTFRVKGTFHMSRGRHMFKVDFCHTLNIDIQWKHKIFSPNKSALLT